MRVQRPPRASGRFSNEEVVVAVPCDAEDDSGVASHDVADDPVVQPLHAPEQRVSRRLGRQIQADRSRGHYPPDVPRRRVRGLVALASLAGCRAP